MKPAEPGAGILLQVLHVLLFESLLMPILKNHWSSQLCTEGMTSFCAQYENSITVGPIQRIELESFSINSSGVQDG